MTPESILTLVTGQGGALVALSIVAFFLYRKLTAADTENEVLRKTIAELQEERLKDAKSAEMLAKAYLSLREQEKSI